jgi:hypothetical protein
MLTATRAVVVAILLGLAALGLGLAALTGEGPGAQVPQTGTVVAVNGPVGTRGPVPTFEGSMREAGGTVVGVEFFTSGGVTLHRGEQITYVQVTIRSGVTTTVATVVISPSEGA